METYVLKRPIAIGNGETLTEICMDLEDLTPVDLESCEKQARIFISKGSKKKYIPVVETNKIYLACVAANASGLTLADIRSLKAQDYTQLCLWVQDFLLDG